MSNQSRSLIPLGCVLSCLIILGGCVPKKTATKGAAQQSSPQESVTVSTGESQFSQVAEMPADEPYLHQCLNDADLLLKTNKKYKDDVTALYRTIESAKHYASVSNKVSRNVSMTATPLYEFRVHDMCNNISNLVLKEMKAEIGTLNK